jgi:DNA gyrase subunit A
MGRTASGFVNYTEGRFRCNWHGYCWQDHINDSQILVVTENGYGKTKLVDEDGEGCL